MGTWLVVWGCLAISLAQAEPDRPAGAANAAVEKAIGELSDASFSRRQQASRLLWEQGLAAEAALERAAASDDREMRLRARSILRDFRYGILPGVPADTVALIRQFRDGKNASRLAALQKLADRGEFDTLQRLIQLEENTENRRQLLVYLMQNPRAVDRFLDVERLEKLIASVGGDRDDTWRRTVLAQMLFSDKMVKELAAKGRLAALLGMLERESAPAHRRQMLTTLFQSPTALASLIEKDQLDRILQLVAKEPEARTRGQWLSQVFSVPDVVKRLAESNRFEQVLKVALDNAEAPQRIELFQRLFQNPPVLTAVIAKLGLDRLVALVGAERDATTRGQLWAAMAASYALRQQLNEDGQRDLALRLLKDEKDAACRGEYLKSLLESGQGYTLFRDTKARKAIWDLVKSEADPKGAPQNWRGEALYQILALPSAEELLKEPAELAWFMRFVREQATAAQRQRILERLVTDYRWQQALLPRDQFEPLLEQIKVLAGEPRGRLMGRLVATNEVIQKLTTGKKLDRLLALANEETDPLARCAYLEGLFGSPAAMSALLEAGAYDALWKLVSGEEDPVRQAILRAEFVRTPPVLQALAAKNQLDLLVKYGQAQTQPEARQPYLERLINNDAALSLLVEKGHFDALLALIGGDPERPSRLPQLAVFYTNTKVVEQLLQRKQIDVWLKFATECGDQNQLQNYVQRLCNSQPAMAALIQAGHLKALLALADKQPEKYSRASMLGAFISSLAVAEYFGTGEHWKELVQLFEKEPDDTRPQLFYPLLGRPETLGVLLDKGRLDDLLALVKKETRQDLRSQWLAMLVLQPRVVERLAAQKRLSTLIQLVREQQEDNARRQFMQMLFNNQVAVGALLDQGHFESLYDLANLETEPRQRAQHLGQLLSNSKTIEYLVAAKKVALLLKLVEEQDDEPLRRTFLTCIFSSPSAVTALVEHAHFDRMLQLCRAESDVTARRRLLAEFLLSAKAIEQLAQAGSLAPIVTEILAEPNRDARRQLLERCLARPEAVAVLVDKGQFDPVYKLAQADLDPARCRQLLGNLLTAPNAVTNLAAHGHLDTILKSIANEGDISRRSYYLQSLVQKPEAVKAVLAGGRWEELWKLVNQEPAGMQRGFLLTNLLFTPATVDHLIKSGQIERFPEAAKQQSDPQVRRLFVQRLLYDEAGRRLLGQEKMGTWLLTLLQGEPDEPTRLNAVRQVLQNSRVWQVLLESGQRSVLDEIAKLESDEALRQTHVQRFLYAPSGLLPYHLKRGELPEAERTFQQELGSDLGRLRWATYLLVSGQLDKTIVAVRQRVEQQPAAPTRVNDARLLAYLCRAQGDLAGARTAAELTQDPSLIRAVLVEQRQWADAARLQAAQPCPLPIAWPALSSVPETHQRVEQLGLVAAYQRLAANAAGCEQALTEIRTLVAAAPTDDALQWYGVEALLLNDQVGPGLQLLATVYPPRAFDLYAARHEYRAALELAKWREGAAPDRAWLEALPIGRMAGEARPATPAAQPPAAAPPPRLNAGGPAAASRAAQPVATAPSNPELLPRFEFGLRVARLLHLLGRQDEARQVLDVLEEFAQSQSDDGRSSATPRRQCWERLAATLLALNYEQRAWDTAARTLLDRETAGQVLMRFYPRRFQEANGWWTYFRIRHASEMPAATFARVHRLLEPLPQETADEFLQLATAAEQAAAALSDSRRDTILLAVGESAQRRGQWDLARRSLEPLRATNATAAGMFVEALIRSQQWAAAAEACEMLWQLDHDQLPALYLGGEMLVRAGRAAEGRQRKEQASVMALDSKARLGLAVKLHEHGLKDEAAQQFQIVLRTAPFEYLEWYDAARYLGEQLAEQQPAAAADLLEFLALDDLRTYFHLLDDRDYLRVPAGNKRLRARAAVAAGRFEVAVREADLALAALPGDTFVSEQLVPALEKAGQRAQADALFQKVHAVLAAGVQAYPQSALLHNEIAWQTARCGRLLEEAQTHADRAVALAPNSASYLDTLAEVQFRRGDRAAAIANSKRSVQLRPDDATLKQQLERFQKEPLPK